MVRQMWDEETLQKKRPVWDAISWLYLDTDTNLEIDRIVTHLTASDYSLDELTRIYETEVAPAVFWSQCSIAGEWCEFNLAWLEEQIRKHYPITSKLFTIPIFGSLYKGSITLLTRYQWKKVIKRLQTEKMQLKE